MYDTSHLILSISLDKLVTVQRGFPVKFPEKRYSPMNLITTPVRIVILPSKTIHDFHNYENCPFGLRLGLLVRESSAMVYF